VRFSAEEGRWCGVHPRDTAPLSVGEDRRRRWRPLRPAWLSDRRGGGRSG
jgi:hypothetical protein